MGLGLDRTTILVIIPKSGLTPIRSHILGGKVPTEWQVSPPAARQSMAPASDDPKNIAQTTLWVEDIPPTHKVAPPGSSDPHPTQGGFHPPMPPDDEEGWALEGGPRTRLHFPQQGEPGEPWLLSKRSASYCTQAGSLTLLQIRPSLASPLAPGEQPGALSEVESPLATPQVLQLPVKGCSFPSSPQGLLPSLLATVSLLALLRMKHKPGWVIARGSRAASPALRRELTPCSLLSQPQAFLLTSAENSSTLPVVFDLSILLEQQGAHLLHLVLQSQAHPNQGPHEVTGHLGGRRDIAVHRAAKAGQPARPLQEL